MTACLGALLLTAALAPVAAAQSGGDLLEEATEDKDQAGVEDSGNKGGAGCQQTNNVADPVRAGSTAFEHLVRGCGERSEIRGGPQEMDQTLSYGWSVHISEVGGDYMNINQFAAYPTQQNFGAACGGVGHKIKVEGDEVVFGLAVPDGSGAPTSCELFSLGSVAEFQGRWVDIVMVVNWSEDGFLRLWTRTGDEDYEQKIDYQGPTWHRAFNDRGNGPYFKMGAYKGDPGGGDWVVYTDEYRLARGEAFEAVAPGGGAPAPGGAAPAPGPSDGDDDPSPDDDSPSPSPSASDDDDSAPAAPRPPSREEPDTDTMAPAPDGSGEPGAEESAVGLTRLLAELRDLLEQVLAGLQSAGVDGDDPSTPRG
jgi:hypothetical protein